VESCYNDSEIFDVTSDTARQKKQYPFLIDYPVDTVIKAYPLGLIRVYCHIRSHILRNQMMAEIGQYFPFSGRVLELGCGFGLFSNCFALSRPETHFCGIDISAGRIKTAQRAAELCDADNVDFICQDACTVMKDIPRQDCIYMLDLLHHLPPEEVRPFLKDCWEKLRPGGVMVIKDVSNKPFYKMAFTWLLDVFMTRGEIPHYLSPHHLSTELQRLRAQVVVHHINDYLPYPHILYICQKDSE
jgi:2-polyprenyl-3-methyl-5-hydroxy-6-metoxy-1,4-benzoquinol methylase